MTTDELNAIVQAVMLELEKAGVDFDFKAETPQATDLVYVMRGTADKYQGITVKWQNLLDIIVKKATDAKDEAVSAKDIALQTLATIQGIESNVSSMKSSVETTKSQVETMKASVETSEANVASMKASVEASETRVTQIKAEAEQTLAEATQTVSGKADKTYVDGELAKKADKSELAVERARIDNLAKLAEGSTTGDAELIDLRIGADGVTYDNAGTAVRTQVNNLKGDLINVYDKLGLFTANIIVKQNTNVSKEFSVNIQKCELRLILLSEKTYLDNNQIFQIRLNFEDGTNDTMWAPTNSIKAYSLSKNVISITISEWSKTEIIEDIDIKFVAYYKGLLDDVDELIKDVIKINKEIDDVDILVPTIMHSVVGQRVNVCLDSVITNNRFDEINRAFLPSQFIQTENECECDMPNNDLDATVTVYTSTKKSITKAMTFKPVSVNSGIGKTWNVLCLGESTTDNPFIVKYLNDLFTNDVMNINLIGNKENPTGIKNEGRGGWTLEMYRHTQSHKDHINYFYNPTTQDFDFGYYRQTYNIAQPDVIIIYMGINDTANSYSTFISNLDYIINNIKSDSPNVKILVTPPNVPSCVKGTWTYRTNWKTRIHQTISNMLGHYGNRENENIFICPAYVAVNPIYDMASLKERKINIYTNWTGLYIPNNTGDVHPGESGYMKIAVCWYNMIKYMASLN